MSVQCLKIDWICVRVWKFFFDFEWGEFGMVRESIFVSLLSTFALQQACLANAMQGCTTTCFRFWRLFLGSTFYFEAFSYSKLWSERIFFVHGFVWSSILRDGLVVFTSSFKYYVPTTATVCIVCLEAPKMISQRVNTELTRCLPYSQGYVNFVKSLNSQF